MCQLGHRKMCPSEWNAVARRGHVSCPASAREHRKIFPSVLLPRVRALGVALLLVIAWTVDHAEGITAFAAPATSHVLAPPAIWLSGNVRGSRGGG